MSAFGGFPSDRFTFFEGLANDNSRAYWSGVPTGPSGRKASANRCWRCLPHAADS